MTAPILITRNIPSAGYEALRTAGVEFDVLVEGRYPERDELLRGIKGRIVVLTMLHDIVDEEFFEAAGPQLKGVCNYAVGHNNIDLQAAAKRGISVTNTPGVLTEATADIAWTLILMAARRASEGERLVRSGKFEGWEPQMLLGVDLVGKTLGIAGAGRIGAAVARRARGWDMPIIYTARSPKPEMEREFGARRVVLETLCRESDVISVHAPSTPETRGMFGAAQFAMMKGTAIFVNTARGDIHDEAALAAAVRDGQIFSAGLDVYEREPAIHPDLLALDRLALLPHLGSGTIQTRDRMAVMAAENALAIVQGHRPPNLVT